MNPQSPARNLRALSAWLLLAAMLASCTFNFDENVVKRDPEQGASLTEASLNTTSLETLSDTFAIIARTTNLTYSLEFKNVRDVTAKLTIDGQSKTYYVAEANFSINAPDFADGFHTITIEAVTNSGTRSLADELGEETVHWKREWVFSIARVQPPLLNITRIAPVNGQLVIEWESSDVDTEKVLQLKYQSANTSPITWSYRITDPRQTELTDTKFIEGDLTVTLTNESIDPAISSPVSTGTASYAFPAIVESSWDGRGNTIVKWNKSIFYNNISGYSLTIGENVIWKHDSNDTTLTTTLIPFASESVVFRTIARNMIRTGQDTLKLRVNTSVSIGDRISTSISTAKYAPLDPQHGFAIDTDKDEFLVLDGDIVVKRFPMDTITSVPVSRMAVSNDGSYLYFAYNGNILRMDRDGNRIFVLSTKGLYGKKFTITHLVLGGDRFLCFDRGSSIYDPTTIGVFDLQTSKQVFEVAPANTTMSNNTLAFSADGRYLLQYTISVKGIALYKLDGDGVMVSSKRIGTTTTSAGKVAFFDTARNSNMIIILDQENIILYDPLNDASVTKQIEGLSFPYAVNNYYYDAVAGSVGYHVGNVFYVADPTQASLLRSLLLTKYTTATAFYNGSLYRGLAKYNFNL